ncbi:MAG: DegV family protein [Anaerotardibacter sp.]
MEPKCNLIIDSCCDLPVELIPDNVTVLNYSYILDGITYSDDFFQSVTVKEFYDTIRAGATPSTSQISPAVLEEAFRKGCESGIPTVYFSMSGGISSNAESAKMIADMVKEDYPDAELYVVDTLLGCTPEGVLDFEIMRLFNQGFTAAQLVEWASEALYHANTLFMVDDLDALHRGGRLPKSVAAVGDALNVKPLLNFSTDGTLGLVGVARGRKKGIKQMAQFFKENYDVNSKFVMIGNADCPEEAEKLRKEILSIDPAANVFIHTIGTTIGCHVGADMISISFWGVDRREAMSVADRIAAKVKGK